MARKTKKAKEGLNQPVPKIPTYIQGLDAITYGGLPMGRSTLLSGSSGTCKTIIGLQYLVSGIREEGEGAVFVTFEETPADIRRNVESFGWDLGRFEKEGMLAFVDASPEPGQTTTVIGDFDLSGLLLRIENAVAKVKAKRVCIDSISALFGHFENTSIIRQELFRIAAGLKRMGVTSLITAERVQEYGEVARYGVEAFVADNVIIVRNILEQERTRRTIQVLKLRGAPHQEGEYPFTISSDGVSVMPLSAMKLTMESSEVRISSGNAELDGMCGEGFFRDSIILVSGATGTGKTLLATTFMNAACRDGGKALVFAFEESRAQLLRNAKGWGLGFNELEKKGLMRVDCTYPEIMGLPDHLLRMKKVIDEFKPDRIVMDSLSAMERVTSGKAFREFVIGLTSFIKEKQIAGLFTATTAELMGGTSITEEHISTITDSIILLRYVEMMGEMRRGITVLKMRGSKHEKTIREYTIDGDGMHIGKAFKNVGGIIAGTPTHIVTNEVERIGEMFAGEK